MTKKNEATAGGETKDERNARTLHFKFEKSTKGTHRFMECDGDGNPVPDDKTAIGSLYVQKRALGEKADGMRLKMTMEPTPAS